MFKNLRLFSELDAGEIFTNLKAVLTKDKSLVLFLEDRPTLRLVPIESEANWESRMGDVLEPLKVSIKGYKGRDGTSTPFPLDDWLYESNGLQKLLRPYQYKSGLFWVCDESEIAVEIISNFSEAIHDRFDPDFGEINIFYLKNEKGTKLEVLDIDTYYDETKTKRAAQLVTPQISVKSLGTANPDPLLKTHTYPIKTPEFAAVLRVWEKYWADGKKGIKKDALIDELVKEGFTTPSARAIDRVSRPEDAREGRRKK